MARPLFPQARNIAKRGRFRGSFPIVRAKREPDSDRRLMKNLKGV
jgi:hypothetical protein